MTKFENILGGSHKLNDGHAIPWVGLGISRIKGQVILYFYVILLILPVFRMI